MSIAGALTALVAVAGLLGADPGPAPGPPPATVPASSTVAARGWVWPLEPQPEVARPFDRPGEPWLPGHRGVDLLALPGSAVHSPAQGRVGFTGLVAGRPVVVISHGGGLRSTFEPVTAVLPAGTLVEAGDAVGRLAPTPGHCVPATCLHWGVLRGETYLDPLALIGRQRVRLLPLG